MSTSKFVLHMIASCSIKPIRSIPCDFHPVETNDIAPAAVKQAVHFCTIYLQHSTLIQSLRQYSNDAPRAGAADGHLEVSLSSASKRSWPIVSIGLTIIGVRDRSLYFMQLDSYVKISCCAWSTMRVISPGYALCTRYIFRTQGPDTYKYVELLYQG